MCVQAVLLLHFLPGLPEEQVGADRRAQRGDHGHRCLPVKGELRHHHAAQHRLGRDIRNEGYEDIGKQRKRRPLEEARVERIGDEHFKQHRNAAEEHDIKHGWSGKQQIERSRHRAEVRAEIDRVGDQQRELNTMIHARLKTNCAPIWL
jgi:hypothetical protein